MTSDIWILIFDSDESVSFLKAGSSTLESSMIEIEQKSRLKDLPFLHQKRHNFHCFYIKGELCLFAIVYP